MLEDGEWDWYSETTARRTMKQPPQPPGTPGRPAESDADVESSRGRHIPLPTDALALAPMRSRAFVRLHWRSWLVVSLGAVGFVTQLVLAWVGYYLVDLSLDLMEVWVQLARKHLEITL